MGTLRTILVADDEPSIRHVLTLVLAEHGYEVRAVADGEEALKELQARPYDVLVSDVRMPKLDGLKLLEQAMALHPELTVLVMSAYGSKDQALEAVGRGAYDFLQKPFKPEEVVFTLKKAEERMRLVRENRRLRAPQGSSTLEQMLGDSEVMRALKKQIHRVGPVNSTVLITGESGTGKELVARTLHELSPRANEPFVTVNCGAIPSGLIESELFGHARGAFTDARTAKRGLFSDAHKGTILLDEVAELPQAAQVKLLRVLQEGEVRPVGENRVEKVDVRVVAATLRDLPRLVERGEFREDLYFRLNVVQLRVPPLRERKDDVMALARVFVGRFNRAFNRAEPIVGISPEAEAALTSYAWPGNVRELENAIERAVLLSESVQLEVDSLPERVVQRPKGPAPAAGASLPEPQTFQYSLKRAQLELELRFIRAALRKTRGNRTKAAELLEISHRALLYKIKDYGIDPDAEGALGE
ncbi:MAG: sigma-54 dependent transcriptional regulator [Myxococcaceae bacterium]|jgi:two-component system response regulator AtoC|nr:sigma-54 dependent transcriptional regulator [Myxococcaceae bacterium]